MASGQVVHSSEYLDHLFVLGLIVKFKMKLYTLTKLDLAWALVFVSKLREERLTRREIRFSNFVYKVDKYEAIFLPFL